MPKRALPRPGPEPTTTRDRLIVAMQEALRRRGYHGVGLSELLAEAGTPKGVLYHHFPGGKSDLAVAAIQAVTLQMTAALDGLLAREADPAQALARWMAGAQKALVGSDFSLGCPLATIALESTPEDTRVRAALAAGFGDLRQHLAAALHRAGIEASRAASLSALIVSAYEGALLQARVAGRVEAMRDTTELLVHLVRSSLPAAVTPIASTEGPRSP